MTFSLSGSLITQSSTDADLSGLSGVSGVATFALGGKTVYNIGDRMFLISGTLTMDPRTEEIWTGTAVPVGSANGNSGAMIRVTGTFNTGVSIVVNSVQAFPMSTAIRANTQAGASYETYDTANCGAVVVETGGTWNWLYGSVYAWTSIACGTGANTASGTVNIYSKSAQYVSFGPNGLSTNSPSFRLFSTQTNISGFSAIGLTTVSLIGNSSSLSNIDLKHLDSAFSPSGSSPDATWLTVTNYESGGGHNRDFGFWQGKWSRFVNSINGSNMVVGKSSASSNNYGLIESRQAITLTAKNSALSAITTGGWWVTDVDNGSRLAVNSLGNSKTNDDYTTTRTYGASFNGSGVASYNTAGGILTHVAYRTFANAAASPDTATENRRDYRGISNDNSDNFIFRIRAYGYLFTQQTITLKGANGTSVGVTLATNAFVVASQSTAAAYTGIAINGSAKTITLSSAHTLQEVYDYSQAWGSTSGNFQYDECLTTADGSNFTLASGWTLIPGANLTFSGKRLSGGKISYGTAGTYSPVLGAIGIQFTTAGTYVLSGIDATGTLTLTNTSGGAVTVQLPSGLSLVNTGPSITVATPLLYQSVTVTGLIAGSRVQLYDTDSSTELYNAVVSGTSFTWIDSTAALASRAIRLRVAKQSGVTAYLFLDTGIGTCGTSSGNAAISYLASQAVDAVYNANAVDGSTVTGITIADAVDRMLISIFGGLVFWAQIYAYNVYWLTTAAGIQDDGSIIVAKDQANYIVTLFKIKNTGPTPLRIAGGYGVDSVTGSVADILDTTGGSIFPVVDHVVSSVVTVGGVNVITGDISTVLAAIPSASTNAAAVVTAAQSSPLYSNIKQVNSQTISGAGTPANPWGP